MTKKTAKQSAPTRRAAPHSRRASGETPAAQPARPRKKAPQTATQRLARASAAKRLPAAQGFPKVQDRSTTDGCGVVLAVVQKTGGKMRQNLVTLDRPAAASDRLRHWDVRHGGRTLRKEATAILKEPAVAARLLNGAAHPERLRLMAELFPAAGTHHDLKEATGLTAGPLYHHIRELERAGLVVSPARNRYELTEAGRLTFLLTAGLTAMVGPRRPAAPWRSQRGFQRSGTSATGGGRYGSPNAAGSIRPTNVP